ncbi:MAG: sensor histidine kinase, partial [Halohasta sp.]
TLARRVRTTAGRLLDLSETAQKLERNLDVPDDREPVDLRSLADRVADEIGGEHPEASITVTAPDSLVVDSSPRLETALWELVDNAAKHAGESPTVGIEIDTRGEQAVVRVTDDGPGLPELERSVLESGEETPLVHGSGLGLWLIYWIVTGVDGTLEVVDPTTPGTAIEIRLPKQ